MNELFIFKLPRPEYATAVGSIPIRGIEIFNILISSLWS